jgi:hypothetical protein
MYNMFCTIPDLQLKKNYFIFVGIFVLEPVNYLLYLKYDILLCLKRNR